MADEDDRDVNRTAEGDGSIDRGEDWNGHRLEALLNVDYEKRTLAWVDFTVSCAIIFSGGHYVLLVRCIICFRVYKLIYKMIQMEVIQVDWFKTLFFARVETRKIKMNSCSNSQSVECQSDIFFKPNFYTKIKGKRQKRKSSTN